MSEDTKSSFYNLLLTRTEALKDIQEISDFAYLIFIRQPGAKQASYVIAQANIPTATLIVLEAEISAGKLPNYQLQIRHIKGKTENLIYSTFVKLILPKDYNQNKPGITPKGTTPTIPVQFILVNPISMDMNGNNAFNFIFNKEKYIALEIITKHYMDEIKKRRAGSPNAKTIKCQIFADMSTKNKTLYDQVTIPSSISELKVPEYIIDAYKPFSTPSLWLFDMFNFGNYDKKSDPVNGEIPVWCILLNFYNAIESFQKCDISEDLDIKQFTTLLKIVPYTDTLSSLNKPNAVVSFTNTTNMTQVTQKFGDLPYATLTDNTEEKQSQRVSSIEVNYRDDLEEAEKRIVDCVELMKKQINQIEIYETINTSPEWLQFGYLYNLDRDKKTGDNLHEYVHTPLAIFNIFRRQEHKVGRMEHVVKYAMIRFNKKSTGKK